MILHNIPAEKLHLPDANKDFSIIIITNNGLRHKRFALRLIEKFDHLGVTWFELNSGTKKAIIKNKKYLNTTGIIAKLIRFFSLLKNSLNIRQIKKGYRVLFTLYYNYYINRKNIKKAEKQILQPEITRLRKVVDKQPILIYPNDLKTPDFVNKLKSLNAYFLLTLGGPLYKKEILKSVRGLAINQHAGFSPDYKGANTIRWALYHRELNKIASTVHITTSGADSGPILRRSTPCLNEKDQYPAIFNRVVILGTEMMIEVVEDIISKGYVFTFPQNPYSGKTFISKDSTEDFQFWLIRDLKLGWLGFELMKRKRF